MKKSHFFFNFYLSFRNMLFYDIVTLTWSRSRQETCRAQAIIERVKTLWIRHQSEYSGLLRVQLNCLDVSMLSFSGHARMNSKYLCFTVQENLFSNTILIRFLGRIKMSLYWNGDKTKNGKTSNMTEDWKKKKELRRTVYVELDR